MLQLLKNINCEVIKRIHILLFIKGWCNSGVAHLLRDRGGELLVFAGAGANLTATPGVRVLSLPVPLSMLSPVLFTLPLQLLAYHVAVLKGTDVDRPRNLAKSVTVE